MKKMIATVRWSLLAMIGATLGLTACGSPSTTLDSLRVGPVTPATRPLPASAYGLLRTGTTVYTNLDDPTGPPLTITIAKTNRFNSAVTRTLNEQRVEYLGVSDQNNIVMYAATDIARDTTTLFGRPMIMASALQPPLQPLHQEVPARLVDRLNIQDVQAHGICRRSAIYEGSCELQTKLGPIRAEQIQTTFTADLSIAHARYTGLIFVAQQPEPGIVALVLSEELRVFGIQIRSQHGTYLRQDLALPVGVTDAPPSAETTSVTSDASVSSE